MPRVKKKADANTLNACAESIIRRFNGGMAWRNNTTGVYDPSIGTYRKGPESARGSADVLGVIDGQSIAIEGKTPGDTMSPDQVKWRERFEKAGGWYYILTDQKSIDKCIQDLTRRLQLRKS